MPKERRQNWSETKRGSYYNQQEWVEEYLDDKDAFYNGSESDDGDNDDENYNENMEALVRKFLIGALKNFANFTERRLCWSFLLIKFQS